MEDQQDIWATSAQPQPCLVEEQNSAVVNPAMHHANSESCCSWAVVGDGNSSSTGIVNDNSVSGAPSTPDIQEMNSQQAMIVHVLGDVHSNKVGSVPVIVDESGVINCIEPGVIESDDSADFTDSHDCRSTLIGADCITLDVLGSTENQMPTCNIAKCTSHVGLLREEMLNGQSVTIVTDTQDDSAAVQCKTSHAPQLDLTHIAISKTPVTNGEPQEEEKKCSANCPSLDVEEVEKGSCYTSGDVLPAAMKDTQTSKYEEKEEKAKEAAVSGSLAHEGHVQLTSTVLYSASLSQSGWFLPPSRQMLTDQQKQKHDNKGDQNDPFKEDNTVAKDENTEIPEKEDSYDRGPCSTLSKEQRNLSSENDTSRLKLTETVVCHVTKGQPEGQSNSGSKTMPDHSACHVDGVPKLTCVDRSSTEEQGVELAASSNILKEHSDLPTANSAKSATPTKHIMLKTADNCKAGIVVSNLDKGQRKKGRDVEAAEDSDVKCVWIIGADEDGNMTLKKNLSQKGNSDSQSNKSQELDKAFSCKKDPQSQHLWRHSFTCNSCAFTAFSVKDIEDHCAKCEQALSTFDHQEVEGSASAEDKEVENKCTPEDSSSVSPLEDSPEFKESYKDAVEENSHSEAFSNKIEPAECDLPSPDEAQSTQDMLSQQDSTVMDDESPSPLQSGVSTSMHTDDAEVRGERVPSKNLNQLDDCIAAGWKVMTVHSNSGQKRVRKFWQCPDCPFKTDKLFPGIREHGSRHNGPGKFRCDMCTYSCPTESGLGAHRKVHQKRKKAKVVEVQLSSARQLRRRTGRNRNKVFKCSRCSFATLVWASFQRHCKKHSRKVKAARSLTQREYTATFGECTPGASDLKKKLKRKSVNESLSGDGQKGNKAPVTTAATARKVEEQDVETVAVQQLKGEFEVLSATSGPSNTNQSSQAFTEGAKNVMNTPQQRQKTKKYSCIKCSFSCNSWLSVKAHMAVHKKGDTTTAVEDSSSIQNPEEANKVDENEEVADGSDSRRPVSGHETKIYKFKCTKCPFKIDSYRSLQKHTKCHMASKKYCCDYCSFSTSAKTALLRHYRVHSNDFEEGTTESPTLSVTSNGCGTAESSTNTAADKQESLYRCKECPYTADQPSILERHEKCHIIWRWHKRLDEMSQMVEVTVPEPTAVADSDNDANCGSPNDVINMETRTGGSENKMQECDEMLTCNKWPSNTDNMSETERHQVESKYIENNSTSATDAKTSQVHETRDNTELDNKAENGGDESVVKTPADDIVDDITAEKENGDKDINQMARPKIDEYKYIFHCTECPFKTDWLHDLEKHKSGHESKAEFSCDQCSFSAATKGAIEVHRRAHRYEKANRADLSDVGASPGSDAQTPNTFRRKVEEYLYIFNCGQCPFKTDWYHDLEKHRMGHNADLEFPCEHCTFSSSTKRALEVHRRVHKDGSAVNMERTAVSLETNTSKEQKSTQKEKPFRFAVMTPSGLRYYNHKCPMCPFRTDSKKKVDIHLIHHRTKGKHTCDLCTYSTNHLAALPVHKKVHFRKQGTLQAHLHTYTRQSRLLAGSGKNKLPAKKDRSSNKAKSESKSGSQRNYRCPKCPYRADRRKKIDVHMVFHRYKGKHKCNMCSYSSNQSKTLGSHKRVHMQEQEVSDNTAPDKATEVVQSPHNTFTSEPRSDGYITYTCSACPAKLDSLVAIKEHVNHHVKKFPYSCPRCTFGGDSMQVVNAHKRIHEKRQEEDCSQEPKLAPSPPDPRDAPSTKARRMMRKRKFQCEYCPYSTDKLERANSHASKHGANHPNKCHLCSYSTAGSIKLHLRIHEKYNKSTKTKGQKVDTAGSILTVEKIRSGRDTWQYQCNQCPFLAKTAGYVRSHQRYHSADLPLKCPDCTFSCNRLQQFSCHLLWHGKTSSPEGQKGKQTRKGRIGALQHKLYEQGVERVVIDGFKHYVCPHCPFRSRWADLAVAHLEHHSVMYSYKCAFCSYSTRTKDKVKIHMNLHKKTSSDGKGHSTDGGMGQRENEAASSSSPTSLLKGPRTRARLGVIGHSPVKYMPQQVPECPTSSSVSRNLGDFSGQSGSESAFIRYMTPSTSKEKPEEGQEVTVLTFVCMYCERPFTDQESWLAHMKRHRL